jgi:hypothetical protein
MKEARRWPGSEWMKDHPAAMEKVYDLTKRVAEAVYPAMKRVSPRATERLMIWAEQVGKGYVWNCQMCGQCILHSTGMTCPIQPPVDRRLQNTSSWINMLEGTDTQVPPGWAADGTETARIVHR